MDQIQIHGVTLPVPVPVSRPAFMLRCGSPELGNQPDRLGFPQAKRGRKHPRLVLSLGMRGVQDVSTNLPLIDERVRPFGKFDHADPQPKNLRSVADVDLSAVISP